MRVFSPLVVWVCKVLSKCVQFVFLLKYTLTAKDLVGRWKNLKVSEKEDSTIGVIPGEEGGSALNERFCPHWISHISTALLPWSIRKNHGEGLEAINGYAV